jgi:isoleucyl-tRNA synthetase
VGAYIERLGRWVDFKNSYKTMDNSYIESVWWSLQQLHKKKMLYEGRKVLMYCTHCETPLAKAEIAADNTYKDITEEAVTVKFKLRNPQKFGLPENTYLLHGRRRHGRSLATWGSLLAPRSTMYTSSKTASIW